MSIKPSNRQATGVDPSPEERLSSPGSHALGSGTSVNPAGTSIADLRSRVLDDLPAAAVPLLLVATFVLFSILSPHIFFTWTNVKITLAAQATVLLLAIGITIPLRAGDFDLSIPAVMILAGSVTGLLYERGVPAGWCCAAAIAIGFAIGAVNAVLIVGVGLDGLVVTLGMFTLLGGITAYVSRGNLITKIPKSLTGFATADFLGLQSVVWIGWIVAFVVWLVFEFTPLGRYLLFLGGNRSAARLAGLPVARLRSGSFITASTIGAVAGVLLAGSLASVDPSSASGYLLAPLTAAFLGTTTVQIGRFNVLGTLVSLYLLAFGITGLQLLGIQGWVSDVFNGAALIVALTFARYFDVLKTSRARSRARQQSQLATVSVTQP
jgi:ribose transport system permease protein